MKKILLTIAGVAASGVIFAGCGNGGSQPETTAAASTEAVTTQSVPETTTAVESTAAVTEPASKEIYTDESTAYNIQVNKYYTGYLRHGNLEYKNASGESYEYDLEDNVSTHAIEAKIDSEMTEFDQVLDQERTEDNGKTVYYVYGKDDSKYKMVAYKYVGPSGDTSSYAELKVERNSEFAPKDALALLGDEYITVTAK